MMYRSFIQQYAVSRPVFRHQQLLAAQPCLDPLLMYNWINSRRHRLYDYPGIFFGLKQCREVKHGIACNGYSLLLQPDVRIKLEVFVLSPPTLFSCLSGKSHQISRGGFIDIVKLAQIADVTEARPERPGLQAADLGRRAPTLLRYLLDGHAAINTEYPQ